MTRCGRLSVLGCAVWSLRCGVLASPAVDIEGLKIQVAAIRELPFKKEFAFEAVDREGVRKILVEEIDREVPPEKFVATQAVYRLLGLVPEDGFALREATLDVVALGIGGVYFPNRQALYHLTDCSGMALPILAHEITHALQDQHWPIEPRDALYTGNGDRSLAYHAVVEGDAMEVMAEYAKGNPGASRLAPDELGQQFFNAMKIAEHPPILSEPMMMPYVQGQRFVMKLRAAGGWEKVNAALDVPPVSTEQILHPEKFFAGKDLPVEVLLPDFGPLLGAGWRKLDEDTFGEWMTSVVVRLMTDDAVRGLRAAAGWGGDRFALYGCGSDHAFLWGSVWDSEKDAVEFEQAMQAALARLSPEIGRRCANRSGVRVFAAIGALDEAEIAASVKLFEKSLLVK